MRSVLRRVGLALVCLLLPITAPAQAAHPSYRHITLPADAAMHPGAETEWWYYTGHLRDSLGHRFGFELVTFKLALGSRDAAGHAAVGYKIDLALTDEGAKTFYRAINYLAPSRGRTQLATERLTIRMPGGSASFNVDTLPGAELAYHLRGSLPGVALDLAVHTDRAAVLQGGQGVVPMGTGGYSYYYSLTNMHTTGTVTIHGRSIAVSGTTWMDHQWGTWRWESIRGWDWLAANLDNGTSITFSNFTSGHGHTSHGGSVSFPSGRQLITRKASMVPLGPTWISPITKITYPQGWRVRVPEIGLDATVLPSVSAQEMVDPLGIGPTYWEGSGTLRGTLRGKPIGGLTYTELVGYGQRSAVGI